MREGAELGGREKRSALESGVRVKLLRGVAASAEWGYVYGRDLLGRPCLVLRLSKLRFQTVASPKTLETLKASGAESVSSADWLSPPPFLSTPPAEADASPSTCCCPSSVEEGLLQCLVFLMEQAVKALDEGAQQIAVLLDCAGVSFEVLPLQQLLELALLFSTCYPERLGGPSVREAQTLDATPKP